MDNEQEIDMRMLLRELTFEQLAMVLDALRNWNEEAGETLPADLLTLFS